MCSVTGCERLVQARGLCAAHYAKWRKYGDPLAVKQVQLHGLSLRERVEHYTKRGDGCWLWIGAKDSNGYGRLNVNGTPMLAHRVSWIVHRGDLGDTYVLHKCDNPSCVNPGHLFPGSQQENLADMRSKGRAKQGHRFGSEHGRAKLTEEQVRAIRKGEESSRAAGLKFGVSSSVIKDIRNGKTWKHIL